MRWRLLWRMFQSARAGRMGDAAALKGAALGSPAYPEIDAKLAALAEPFPAIDVEALRRLPEGTFGREYARFLDDQGLKPFIVSREVAEEVSCSSRLDVRYTLLHDAFHVLLGFDATLVGESASGASCPPSTTAPRTTGPSGWGGASTPSSARDGARPGARPSPAARPSPGKPPASSPSPWSGSSRSR